MATNKTTIDEFVTRIKNNIPLVYEKGKTEGVEEGLEEGKQAEYDAFWDAFQQNGNRRNYQYAFCERGWSNANLNPKYMMVTSTGEKMFYRCNCGGKTRLDMTEICKKLDASQATSAAFMFSDAFLDNITVDLGNATTLNTCFSSGNIGANKSVKNVALKVTDKCTTFSNAFAYCGATEEIIFTEGSVIASNGLNLQWSKNLSKTSIKSIINALSATTEGLSVTFSETAVNKAFETSEGLADGSTSAEWIALAGNETTESIRPNWNISLV